MRTILLVIGILFSSISIAQRECATAAYANEQNTLLPSAITNQAGVENFIQGQYKNAKTLGEGSSLASVIIKIPVVVHILYSNAAQNISEAQIKSQIDALTRDFRRQNFDTVNTPDRFKYVAADAQIEFYLATADPQGRPTKGIVRKQTHIDFFKTDDKIKFGLQGGDDAWDSRFYLNIWVGNMQSVIGYSSLSGGPAEKDGIVISTGAFGTINTAAPYNMGRTTVHEAGHWLGLKHMWGDYYCGDDLVDDTPKQGNFTSGCPTTFRSSCSNGATGDMYMNYMDYTNDACMNLFTAGQKQRMRSLFADGGPRNSLLSTKGLNKPWVEKINVDETPAASLFKLYPNPAANELTLNFDAKWIGRIVRIVNMNGVVISSIQITARTQTVNLSHVKTGIYFLQGENAEEKIREKFIKL